MRSALTTIAAALLAALVLAAPASAGTTGGTTVPGGTTHGGTGGATYDPHWVPSGNAPASLPSGGTVPAGGTPAQSPPPASPVVSTPPESLPPTPPAPPATPPAGNTGPAAPTTSFARRDIPSAYLKLYRAAGKRYGVDWRLLAALGKNETDHGRSTLPGVFSGLNSANCCSGPMQICNVASCGNVWSAYAIDADGDGVASVFEPADAIYAAAALTRDLERAVGRSSRLVLAAYNAGPGNVQRYRGVPPFGETVTYVRNGIRYLRALRG
ncbi:MAG: peptidoglycan DL-endopeptidase CwlO [Thermoleophilaceae bacterium]|nr:peptidoglycan DL-endopeptidase CwlO [Thermoleophilaceae bacterium]